LLRFRPSPRPCASRSLDHDRYRRRLAHVHRCDGREPVSVFDYANVQMGHGWQFGGPSKGPSRLERHRVRVRPSKNRRAKERGDRCEADRQTRLVDRPELS
jgi:hypothetical protein